LNRTTTFAERYRYAMQGLDSVSAIHRFQSSSDTSSGAPGAGSPRTTASSGAPSNRSTSPGSLPSRLGLISTGKPSSDESWSCASPVHPSKKLDNSKRPPSRSVCAIGRSPDFTDLLHPSRPLTEKARHLAPGPSSSSPAAGPPMPWLFCRVRPKDHRGRGHDPRILHRSGSRMQQPPAAGSDTVCKRIFRVWHGGCAGRRGSGLFDDYGSHSPHHQASSTSPASSNLLVTYRTGA
jgi:hypothetical protein